jgi:hypothetical protein
VLRLLGEEMEGGATGKGMERKMGNIERIVQDVFMIQRYRSRHQLESALS